MVDNRRILVVGRPQSGKLAFIKGLTGSLPQLGGTNDSHAGLSHTLNLKTQYYSASVPIWIDEFDDCDEWSAAFRTREAKEVLGVLGALIFVFARPNGDKALQRIKLDMAAVALVVKACGFNWDGVCLAVGMPSKMQPHLKMSAEEWEDFCQESEFEYVDFDGEGRNDHGEPVGMERLREALEANDWERTADKELIDTELSEDEDSNVNERGEVGDHLEKSWRLEDDLSLEDDKFEGATFNLHASIYWNNGRGDVNGNSEAQVDKLENAILKLQAVRGITDASKAEHRKLAAGTFADIVRTI